MRVGRRRRDKRSTTAVDTPLGPDDLDFALAGTLQSPSPSARLLATGVSFENAPIALWEVSDSYIVSYGLDGNLAMTTKPLDARFPTIQSLPGDRVLICESRVAGTSTNAWIFSADGQAQSTAHIGDGIAHVLTTPAGSIWVGYFDEGVYGGSEPARHGIVRFDDSLTPVWKYPFSSPHGPVDDCYTLNVDGESAVSCFYSDFPIVRVSGAQMSGWTGAPTGSHGLLQSGASVLLFGGYSEDRNRVVRLALKKDGTAEQTGRGVVRGVPTDVPVSRFCRGAEAHVFVGADWYRASMYSGPRDDEVDDEFT